MFLLGASVVILFDLGGESAGGGLASLHLLVGGGGYVPGDFVVGFVGQLHLFFLEALVDCAALDDGEYVLPCESVGEI